MNTKIKIRLDRIFAGTMARFVNGFVIILGKILRIDHSLNKDFKVIAICKYKGMGSIIQSTPLLQTLRSAFPDSKIIYISSDENLNILKQIPVIDEIICINDRSLIKFILSVIPFIIKLQKKKIEVYIDLEVYSNFSTLITILSLSKNRMGFYLNSMHYRLGNYTHMMYYNTRNPISETYLQFARLLNCKNIISELLFLNISGGISVDFNITVTEKKYFLINPNASDLRIERRWEKEKWVKLIRQIRADYPDYDILLTGSLSEEYYVSNIICDSGIDASVYSLAGKTGIPQLISAIKNAALFITNDSGPMHIAFSIKSPTIALFGPCSPEQYNIPENCAIIYENLYCSPCVHEFVMPPCRGNNNCMKAISTESVMQEIHQIINKNIYSGKRNYKRICYNINNFTIGTLNR